ncbi:MAG: hypothetical protein ACD_70C00147G0002 [uncultured bacterium]|nr:MAG: hypothetical protein ACD_70C00147G0002 [uncultured bacterium]
METQFAQVEKKIKALVEQYNQLAHFKKKSHLDQTTVIRERAILHTKQQKAIAKLKALIAQLKSFEQSL